MLIEQAGVAVSLSTICRFLHRIGFSPQNLCSVIIYFRLSMHLMFPFMTQKCKMKLVVIKETPLEYMATVSEGTTSVS